MTVLYFLRALLIFALPTCVVRFFLKNKIGKNVKMGFSLFFCRKIEIGDNTHLNSFNIFRVEELIIAKNVRCGSFNIFSGKLHVMIGENCYIGKLNKISNPSFNSIKSYFKMGDYSNINVGHLFDLTHNITLSSKTVLAGVGTQVWTHSFCLPTKGKKIRIEKPVLIGENNYIGSRSIILAGVETANNVVVGAGSVVSKSLLQNSALYVGRAAQMVRKIDADLIAKTLKEYDNILELDEYFVWR